MTEIQMYAGRCSCGKKLDMRITNSNEGEKTKRPIKFWMIHGFCRKCKIVFMQGLFPQEEEPVENRDYIIEWNKKVKPSKKKEDDK